MEYESLDKKNYLIIAIVGLILIIVGSGLSNIMIIYTVAAGIATQYVGIGLLAGSLLYGSIRDQKLSPNVRLGMMIAVGIIIGFMLTSTFSQQYFRYYW